VLGAVFKNGAENKGERDQPCKARKSQ